MIEGRNAENKVDEAFKSKVVGEGTTRERILGAAIAVIEREGTDKATVRAIAAEAGVNVAAINYHYRSKEELMEAAVVSTWSHAVEDMRKFLEVGPGAIGGGVEALVLYLLKGGRYYPKVTKAHILGGGEGPYPAVMEGLKAFVAESARVVAAALGLPLDEVSVVRTSALFFFCLYSALVPESLPPEISSGDLRSCASILTRDYLASLARPVGKPFS
ncbi:MAG: TetR/AcrR family transcriptional regulator [Spirochaetes bacterium]|nr:TetR/AcrR family transcriptional regulator [Spirochaetota bacterium]